MYFIPMIIQMYCLTPILKKINMGGVVLLLFVSIVTTYATMTYCIKNSASLPLLYIGAPFPFMLCYYALGGHLRGKSMLARFNVILTITIVFFLLTYFEHIYLIDKYRYFSAVRPVNRIFCFAAVILLFSEPAKRAFCKVRDSAFVRVAVYLGKISFGVYLIHIYVIKAVDLMFPAIADCWSLSWIAVVAMTAMIIRMISRLLPKKIQSVLGLTQ